jgi:hypothetical protein
MECAESSDHLFMTAPSVARSGLNASVATAGTTSCRQRVTDLQNGVSGQGTGCPRLEGKHLTHWWY